MIKPVKVTFKQGEEWLSDFINSKSSPSAYLKDLAIADCKGSSQRYTEDKTTQQSTASNLFDMLD